MGVKSGKKAAIVALLVVFVTLLLTPVTSAVNIEVEDTTIVQGNTVTLTVKVTDGGPPENFKVKLRDPFRKKGGLGAFRRIGYGTNHNWEYYFDETPGKKTTVVTASSSSPGFTKLTIKVPDDADVGDYKYKIKARSNIKSCGRDKELAVVKVTPIPEFTTIAIPTATVLGLVFLMQRRKKE